MKNLLGIFIIALLTLTTSCSGISASKDVQGEATIKIVERVAPGEKHIYMAVLYQDGTLGKQFGAEGFLLQKGDTVEFKNGKTVGVRFCKSNGR